MLLLLLICSIVSNRIPSEYYPLITNCLDLDTNYYANNYNPSKPYLKK